MASSAAYVPAVWADWVGDLSPFSWTALVPVESWTTPAAAGLAAAIVVLLAFGFGALRQRDLTAG